MQIIGHRCQPRGDDAAHIIARAIHDVERHRRAEINHHYRRAEAMTCGHRISQAVRAYRFRVGIIDADAA